MWKELGTLGWLESKYFLREFVLNSRHPGPRRVWKGGSEPRLLTPDPRDNRDPRESRMSSILAEIDAQASKKEQDVALALCFFDF